MALCERNLGHPDGYNFYIDIDIDDTVTPDLVASVFQWIRQNVIEYVVGKQVGDLVSAPNAHGRIMDLVAEGTPLRDAVTAIGKGLDPADVDKVVALFEAAMVLYDATRVTMKEGCINKFHVHFPGLVVNLLGCRDIMERCVRTIRFKDRFGEKVFRGIDTINYQDHQLRMLGSRKGPREHSFYQVCVMRDRDLVFHGGTTLLQPVCLEDLVMCSVFPISPKVLSHTREGFGVLYKKRQWGKTSSVVESYSRQRKRQRANPSGDKAVVVHDSADEDIDGWNF
jgi:hypothetical protein